MVTGISPTGAETTGLSAVIDSLPCKTEVNDDKLVMPIAGQTAIDYRIMHCDLVDIRMKDVVTIVSSPIVAIVGAEYLVTKVAGYNAIPHLEVEIEGGTLDASAS